MSELTLEEKTRFAEHRAREREAEKHFFDKAQPWKGWKVPSMEKWPKGMPTHWQPFPLPSPPGGGNG